VELLVLFPNLS